MEIRKDLLDSIKFPFLFVDKDEKKTSKENVSNKKSAQSF